MRCVIVLPTYNERENLTRLLPILLALPQRVDILVVDDASPDGTGQVADAIARQAEGRVRVLHRAQKLGLGSAYVAGFKSALEQRYDLIFEMDADFQHDPHDLPRFVDAIERADVVIGSRYVSGGATTDWSMFRRAISRGGATYTRLMLGLPYQDVTTGFRCYRADVLRAVDLDLITTTGFGFQVEILYRCHLVGARIAELPIIFHVRRSGRSKMTYRIFVEAMVMVWRLRSDGAAAMDPSMMHTTRPVSLESLAEGERQKG